MKNPSENKGSVVCQIADAHIRTPWILCCARGGTITTFAVAAVCTRVSKFHRGSAGLSTREPSQAIQGIYFRFAVERTALVVAAATDSATGAEESLSAVDTDETGLGRPPKNSCEQIMSRLTNVRVLFRLPSHSIRR